MQDHGRSQDLAAVPFKHFHRKGKKRKTERTIRNNKADWCRNNESSIRYESHNILSIGKLFMQLNKSADRSFRSKVPTSFYPRKGKTTQIVHFIDDPTTWRDVQKFFVNIMLDNSDCQMPLSHHDPPSAMTAHTHKPPIKTAWVVKLSRSQAETELGAPPACGAIPGAMCWWYVVPSMATITVFCTVMAVQLLPWYTDAPVARYCCRQLRKLCRHVWFGKLAAQTVHCN
jgi:hypothetical protein